MIFINIFSVYGEKCLLRKAFHNRVEKRDKSFADDEEVELSGCDNSQNFYAADFDALVKRWDERVNVGGGYDEK
jgi:hypothetical protein